jgi:hypothetical protein
MSDLPSAAQAAAGLIAIANAGDAVEASEAMDARSKAVRRRASTTTVVASASAPRVPWTLPPRASRANKRSTLARMCKECGTTDTPSWRRGADGARTLCNACGLKFLRDFRKDARLKGEIEPAHLVARPLAHPIPPKKRRVSSLSSSSTSLLHHDVPADSSAAIPHDDVAPHLDVSPPHSDSDASTATTSKTLSDTAAHACTAIQVDAKKARRSVDFDLILNDADLDNA